MDFLRAITEIKGFYWPIKMSGKMRGLCQIVMEKLLITSLVCFFIKTSTKV